MNRRNLCEAEEKRIEKLQKFQLPSSFKKIGVGIIIMAIIGLIAKKISGVEVEYLSQLLKSSLIFGLLLISISKDQEEDELIVKLRAQSYALAFTITVVYALITPFINLVFDTIFPWSKKGNYDMASFQILFYMLSMQIMFFYFFKKRR